MDADRFISFGIDVDDADRLVVGLSSIGVGSITSIFVGVTVRDFVSSPAPVSVDFLAFDPRALVVFGFLTCFCVAKSKLVDR